MTYPKVLAFEKKLVPSDAYLYGTTWNNKDNCDPQPLSIAVKTVRATKSNKGQIKPEETNIQTVDYCSLSLEQDTLKLSFTLKILSNIKKSSACDVPDFQVAYEKAVDNYQETHGFELLARRYAVNIANARYLWRNRVGANRIRVEVIPNEDSEKMLEFTQEDMELNDFEFGSDKIDKLSTLIADALSGKLNYLLLEINAFAEIGKAQDVYPSEEFVQNKDSVKSKELYLSDGIAAMHSQKVGNAIRTIDTWYPNYVEKGFPIAIEPFGSVTNLSDAYRRKDTNKDFFTLFKNFVNDGKLDNPEDEHYVMAVLIRGGVFGGKSE